MVAEVLSPGVKDGSHAQNRFEVVAAKLQQGRRGAGEQRSLPRSP